MAIQQRQVFGVDADGLLVPLQLNPDGTLTVGAPVGGATAAKQDEQTTALDSIDTKLTDVATQTTLALIKAKTDNIPALGQADAAASVPVILPSATVTALTPPAAITGFATAAKQDTLAALLDGTGITTLTATIANGASLSGAVDLAGRALLRIIMPGTWTTANLTFQSSMDNSAYGDLYTATGTEYTVTAAASRNIIVPPADFASIRWLKVRSGTAGAAVNQGGARDIILVVRAI